MSSQHLVKPTIGRPSSKPRSHNPLLSSIRSSGEASSSGDNASPVEETTLSRRNNKIRTVIDTELLKDKVQVHNNNGLPANKVKQLDTVMRNTQDTWGEDFEDIYEDEFEGNSLCSSVASLLYKEHELSKNVDLVSLCCMCVNYVFSCMCGAHIAHLVCSSSLNHKLRFHMCNL